MGGTRRRGFSAVEEVGDAALIGDDEDDDDNDEDEDEDEDEDDGEDVVGQARCCTFLSAALVRPTNRSTSSCDEDLVERFRTRIFRSWDVPALCAATLASRSPGKSKLPLRQSSALLGRRESWERTWGSSVWAQCERRRRLCMCARERECAGLCEREEEGASRRCLPLPLGILHGRGVLFWGLGERLGGGENDGGGQARRRAGRVEAVSRRKTSPCRSSKGSPLAFF